MILYEASDTFKKLWKNVIEDLLEQICNKMPNYCVRFHGNISTHFAIGQKFEEYKSKALDHMAGNRLDRHKLSACICGAIIEEQPLVGYQDKKISKNANEIFAMYVGLNVLKLFMIADLFSKETGDHKDAVEYLKEHFDMEAPSLDENICDTKNYRENMAYALYRSHHQCDKTNKMCYHFDIWAYAKIFYHLEIYNQKRLAQYYEDYKLHRA